MLTDGTLGYMQARKIVDTPFPFPHAQLIIMALVLFAFFCPTIMVAYITEPWLIISLNFMTTWIYFGVNEVPPPPPPPSPLPKSINNTSSCRCPLSTHVASSPENSADV